MVALLANRQARTKGGLVTFGTVVGLVAAMAVTLLGTGAAENAIASYDASSWLWSSNKGEVARVNGVTGRVDTRTKISDAQGHTMQVSQSDRYVILRDLNTGRISVLDLSSLALGATTQSTPGLGVTVALRENVAFIIDAVQGLVRQLDPATLQPVGQALNFPPGIGGGVFDDSGRLWLLIPSEGTVVAIRPVPVPSQRPGQGGQGGGAGGDQGDLSGNPGIVRTVDVADPSHDLTLSILDAGVAVLDKTTMVLTSLRGEALHKVTLALTGPGAMPLRTVGADVPVTVVDDRHVYVVNGDNVTDFAVPGESPRLQPCVAWAGRLYCADDASGTVYVLDTRGQLTNTIKIANGGRSLELEVREDHLFINAPDSSTARVIDNHHHVKVVDKYANNVVGGDPPPVPPPPPPTKPLVGPPGAPAKVSASAGNASARIVWTAAPPNGAAIVKYVVEGDGQVHDVGANQRALDVGGLTNGQEYRFTVFAVNSKGNGPKRAANPVVPTSDVPDAPASVTAKANPDGTVTITWPPANGQGRKITRYTVTWVSKDGTDELGGTDQTTLISKPNDLKFGTQYAFRVIAVNDKGGTSAPSPLSASVVPFMKPAAPPGGVQVRAVTTKRGTVAANWRTPDDRGAPITGYEITANGQKQTTGTGTALELSGYPDNTKVDVTVRAINKAGPGDPVSGTGNTLAAPTMTVQSARTSWNSITVTFTATDGGGAPATCDLTVGGGGTARNGCGGTLTVTGLSPGTAYAYTVTVTNAAGMTASGGATVATPAYRGTVICTVNSYCGRGAPNGGIWVYTTPSQSGRAVGDVYAPDTYEAVCQTSGGNVNATPWGGKSSSSWVKIKFPGAQQNYIPYAWFRMESGDSLAPLPRC